MRQMTFFYNLYNLTLFYEQKEDEKRGLFLWTYSRIDRNRQGRRIQKSGLERGGGGEKDYKNPPNLEN